MSSIEREVKPADEVRGKGIPRPLRNVVGAGILIGGSWLGGAGITELNNNVPMTTETIKTDLAWPWTFGKSSIENISKLFEKQSSIMNDYPDKKIVSPSNLIVVKDLDDIKDISPLPAIPTPKHDIYLLQPIANIDPTKPLEYSMDLAGKNDANPTFSEPYRQEAIKNNVRNMLIINNVPKDSILLAPIDGQLMFVRMVSTAPDGTVNLASITYVAADGTVQSVAVSMGIGQFPIPLIDATPFTGYNDKFFVPVKRGQPIMKTSQQGDVCISTTAKPNQLSTELYPTNMNFLSIPDPKTGEQKTVMIAIP